MSLPSLVFHAFVLFSLLGLAAIWCDNMRRLTAGSPLPVSPCREAALPLVSILIPARNEARNIGECVGSVLQQEHRHLETLILDDGSTDATARIAAETAGGDPRVCLYPGASLPDGWTGKNWACHQLAAQAGGEWLLFLDADTRLAPAAVGTALAIAVRKQCGCLTTWPRQEVETFAERALIPLMLSVLYLYLPIGAVENASDPRFAAANGQFLLFRRECYDAIGGHEAVRASLLDDVSLARRVKECGFRLGVFDAVSLVRCRMYAGLRELWQGFSKNLFPGLGASVPGALLFALLNLLWFVVPPALLFHGALIKAPSGALLMPALETGLMAVVNGWLARRFHQTWWFPLAFPLAIVTMLALLAHSAWRFRTGRGAEWKGRVCHLPAPEGRR